MIQLIHGDCLDIMPSLPPIDMAFADFPFNIDYKYDTYGDKLDYDIYYNFVQRCIHGMRDKLKPTGSMFVCIGDESAGIVKTVLDKSNLKFRNWIVWHYSFAVNCTKKFARSHSHILYCTKSNKFTFNADDVRIPSLRQSKYNDKRANPKGKIPDDVWDFNRVCGTHKERTKHVCQQPESLLERVIKVSTNKDDLIFDPFGGSFTTATVAKKLGRNCISCDISDKYVKDGQSRINNIQQELF